MCVSVWWLNLWFIVWMVFLGFWFCLFWMCFDVFFIGSAFGLQGCWSVFGLWGGLCGAKRSKHMPHQIGQSFLLPKVYSEWWSAGGLVCGAETPHFPEGGAWMPMKTGAWQSRRSGNTWNAHNEHTHTRKTCIITLKSLNCNKAKITLTMVLIKGD